MKLFKRLLGVLLGAMCIGLGVALNKIATLGQDPLAAFTFSFVYLFDEKLPYSVWYIIINLFFFIFELYFLRNRIGIGTIFNFLVTGVFSDIFLALFALLDINVTVYIVKLLISMMGLATICFGIAMYAGANLGIAPYDAISIILCLKFKKIKFKYIRIMLDASLTIVALIVGVIIVGRTDLININTILTFIFAGPLITLFSRFIVKHYYKQKESDFV